MRRPRAGCHPYPNALRVRRRLLGDGTLTWLDLGPEVLAFTRDSGLTCVVNLSPAPIPLPPHEKILLTSGPLEENLLPTDTAAWLT